MRISRQIGAWCATGLTGILLVGCASDSRPHDVPSAALRTVEGNQRLVYTAADPGTVWVTEGSNNIIYSTPVSLGDRVVLDPDVGKVTLNDQVVLDKDVNHNNHKVFFLPGAAPTAAQTASDRSLPRPEGVPMAANIGGEGKDRVEYTAQADGFVWITDEDQHRVLYSAPVGRGDVITIDPQKNIMSINSHSISNQDVSHNNHRIFFSTERPVWRSDAKQILTRDHVLKPADVPADAVSRAEGSSRIDFVAERDGTVWIADTTTGQTVYTGRILRNDKLTLDPTANLLTLNGQSVHTQDLPRDRYHVYFSDR